MIKLTITSRCIACDECRLICPDNAIFMQNSRYFIDEWSCTLCSLCQEVCPVNCIKSTNHTEITSTILEKIQFKDF